MHSRTALAGLLLALPIISSAFLPSSSSSSSSSSSPSSHANHHLKPRGSFCLQQSLEKNDHQDRATPREEDGAFRAHVVASDALILPGEGMTLFLENEEAFPLIQNCLNGGPDDECGRRVVVAVRLLTGDLQLAPVASLCEISEVKFGSPHEYIQIDLQCTGQVRLQGMTERYSDSHFTFRAQHVDATFQDETELDKAIRIERKIETLVKTVSRMEQEIEQELCEQHRQTDSHALRPRTCFLPPNLYDQYEAAKANVERCLTKTRRDDDDTHRLAATSWGVFHCLNDPKLEARYRPRALVDRENLLERIKMAQHALREKKVHLQGRLLELQSSEEGTVREDYFDALDAFQ